MQKLILIIMLLSTIHLQGQEKKSVEQRISQLFIATDERDWESLTSIFSEEVELDYSSMSGNPATKLSPAQIIDSWKSILPGFQFTHHQIGNFQVEIKGKDARVFCYGTATHYLEDPGGNLWTVVGSYDFDLKLDKADNWRVDMMRFNLKYMDGNLNLAQKAMQLVKSGSSISDKNNKETVRKFFQLLEEENIEEFIDLFAEDAEQINPYASGLFPAGAKGKEALRNYWEPVPGNFEGMQFHIEELLATEDPNIIFVKYQGKIKLKGDAGFYENQYYSTFRFDEGGKILEYVEIFNPVVAARGFGLLDQLK